MKNELMKLVTELKQKISSKYPLNLLMLVEREGYSNFRLFISSEALKSDLATVSLISKEISKMLTNNELKVLAGIEVVDSRSKFFIEMRDYLENNGNPEELYNLEFGGLKITRALMIVSPVHHSRKYVREAELKQVLMLLSKLFAREYLTKEEFKRLSTRTENFSILSSEKQNQLPGFTSPKTLQNKRDTIFQKDSING